MPIINACIYEIKEFNVDKIGGNSRVFINLNEKELVTSSMKLMKLWIRQLCTYQLDQGSLCIFS